MIDLGRFRSRILGTREIPPRDADMVEIPAACRPELRQALVEQGFRTLYRHQAEMFERALAGESVVVTTGTASGKSLGYLLPILQSVLENPASRAILLFPTKALGQDQMRGLGGFLGQFGERRLEAGVYDGDTPPAERSRIRERANLILTNPDMLNSGFLPNHGRKGFSHIFRNVRWVVVDEAHTYRGAFGAHFSNLMRRFQRVCAHYGSRPQFLLSSATIANPVELAERLCHRPFSLVDRDGSPSAGKIVHFWQPPFADRQGYLRRSVVQEMARLVPHLAEKRLRFIAFCRSRKETEVVLKESRDALASVAGSHDESDLVAGYRGGYTPEERRAVERGLVEGRLLGVVSTNALELGIDIGQLEIVVQAGFPGTRASFWQQIGRAGRRGRVSHAIVILAMSPIDQYIGLDPDWLVSSKAESAVVDPDNLTIELAHVRAAAAELPLTLDDTALFPDLGEVIPVLKEAGEVREIYGTYHWSGGPFPAGEFSLRNVDPDRFKIVNRSNGTILTEMDRPQTYREAFPRAIYLHDGIQYMVETLDLVGRVATVVPVEQDYYTEPDVRTAIDVLLCQERRGMGRTKACFGDVLVVDSTIGYKMLQFHNHQNLGYEVLAESLSVELETEAVWLPVPEDVLQVLGAQATDTLRGMVHGVTSFARMKTMAEVSDVQGRSFHCVDEESGKTVTALVFYDCHPGGLGYSAKAYELVEEIVRGAIALVEHCRCRDGCPACVGDYHLEKGIVAWGLRGFFERTAPPEVARGVGRQAAGEGRGGGTAVPVARFGWEDVAERWPEIAAELGRTGGAGAELVSKLRGVARRGPKLVLGVESPGAAEWMNEEANRTRLGGLVAGLVRVPPGFEVVAEASGEDREKGASKGRKLRRRLDDLKGKGEGQGTGGTK